MNYNATLYGMDDHIHVYGVNSAYVMLRDSCQFDLGLGDAGRL